MRTSERVGLIAASMLLGGCQGARDMMSSVAELQEVRRQVIASVHHEDVNINLMNGRYLTVALVNSPMKALREDQKQTKAREIAVTAYKALPSRANLERVAVVFVVHRSYLFVFNYNDGTDYHAFSARDLQGDAPGT